MNGTPGGAAVDGAGEVWAGVRVLLWLFEAAFGFLGPLVNLILAEPVAVLTAAALLTVTGWEGRRRGALIPTVPLIAGGLLAGVLIYAARRWWACRLAPLATAVILLVLYLREANWTQRVSTVAVLWVLVSVALFVWLEGQGVTRENFRAARLRDVSIASARQGIRQAQGDKAWIGRPAIRNGSVVTQVRPAPTKSPDHVRTQALDAVLGNAVNRERAARGAPPVNRTTASDDPTAGEGQVTVSSHLHGDPLARLVAPSRILNPDGSPVWDA